MWSQYVSPAKPKSKSKTKSSSSAPKRKKPAATASAQPRGASDWRQQVLERMRTLILEADPDMIEERKWVKKTNPAGVPVFSHAGIVCTGESYKAAVKLTFMHGASLPDPAKLFNAGFDGNVRRAIDIPEGGSVDAKAFKALIKAAVARNVAAQAE